MDIRLQKSRVYGSPSIKIAGSKSETNRLLLLQAFFPEITFENASGSDDSAAMENALQAGAGIIDVGHAGTAMRFLTAYFAITPTDVTLTGSDRMKQRPIAILVEALRELGADISYLEKDGFPPLKITGKQLTKSKVTLDAGVSSQYVSALLLIAPKLLNGLELTLEGQITSRPYIGMTLSLLNEIGIKTSFEGNVIQVFPKAAASQKLTIESDWSSASYFYGIVALSEAGTKISLSEFRENSFQGDSALIEIYRGFGVETAFADGTMTLTKKDLPTPLSINLDLNDTPDLAQTVAVTCFGLGCGCTLVGMHTLRIKETDRLEALKSELEKLGAEVSITADSLTLLPSAGISKGIKIKTYGDHRMAMAFAPLAVKAPILIEEAEVVRKSYPAFWDDLRSIGFNLEKA